MKIKGKKGFIGDASTAVAILLAFALVIVVGIKFFTAYNESYQDSSATDQGKGIVQNLFSKYAKVWDGAFMLVFGLLCVALILSVAALGTRPEFFFVTIIIGMFLIGVAALLANVYSNATGTQLAEAASQLTFIPLIMGNLATITLFMVAMLIIGLFVKARGII